MLRRPRNVVSGPHQSLSWKRNTHRAAGRCAWQPVLTRTAVCCPDRSGRPPDWPENAFMAAGNPVDGGDQDGQRLRSADKRRSICRSGDALLGTGLGRYKQECWETIVVTCGLAAVPVSVIRTEFRGIFSSCTRCRGRTRGRTRAPRHPVSSTRSRRVCSASARTLQPSATQPDDRCPPPDVLPLRPRQSAEKMALAPSV